MFIREQTFFNNPFIPSTKLTWNDLSDEIKTAPSVASFKYRLNNNLKKKTKKKKKTTTPKYYDTGFRIGQIFHARLRMECSSINAKNIVHSPTCSCGGFESTYHFFFQCPNYAVIRRRYLSNFLPTLNTNQVLYGITDASVVENEALFSQVQKLIIHSKRFV